MTKESQSSAPGCPARFDDYEIHGIRKIDENDRHLSYHEQVPDDEAEFWSLFGHIPDGGVDCIGDFATREHAEEIFARITGRRYTDGEKGMNPFYRGRIECVPTKEQTYLGSRCGVITMGKA